MYRSSLKICLTSITALILLLSSPAFSNTGEIFFKTGIQASRTGNHTLALKHFQSAEKAGLKTPALFFNLGVTFYQLGRLTEAKQAFQQATRSKKMAALAYYNLGLIARDQNNTATAKVFFARAEETANTAKLRKLSRYRRQQLDKTDAHDDGRGFLWLETSLGHDDNALLLPSEQTNASGVDDIFAGAMLYGRYRINEDRDHGLHLDGFISHTQYADISDADFNIAGIGGRYIFDAAQWRHDIGLALTQSRLGGDSLENTTRLNYSALTSLLNDLQLKLEFRHDRINATSAYDYLDGSRQILSGVLSGKHRVWSLGYALENNKRNNYRDANEFRSYSPLRHKLTGRRILRLDEAWSLELEGSYQQSRYGNKDIRADGAEKTRSDVRTELAPAIYYTQLKGWRAGAELRRTDNRSNLDEFDYKRTFLLLTLDRLFHL